MTNEEEKIPEEILEEENDITLEEAAEEAEELQEETQDEGRAIEIPVERREDILERQVLRDGGLRDAGHPEMIQTHMDNFLAKIAGETPVDDKPWSSTEFWLNEIANKFGNGDGIGSIWRVKEVWSNPEPDSNFDAQTILIDLSEYDALYVIAKVGASASSGIVAASPIKITERANVMGMSSAYLAYRTFTTASTGIGVSTAIRVNHGESTTTQTTAAIIPVRIYGIKF